MNMNIIKLNRTPNHAVGEVYKPHAKLNIHDPENKYAVEGRGVYLLGCGSTRRAWFGIVHRHLLPSLFGDVVMKDSNDAQTIDWVDEVEVVSKEVATPDLGFHITENAALDKALNRIVNITLQDLLAEYN
jgi:isopentenyl phosphate kinase